MTNKAAVANLLVDNAKNWVSTTEITNAAGVAGTRRLRELRADGWSINTKREGKNYFYKLSRVPAKKTLALYA